MTEWRDIPEFEGFYQVSSDGRVRSHESHVAPRWGGAGGNETKQWLSVYGYPMVTLWIRGKRTGMAVHKAVLTAFVGPRPKGYTACHYNGNRTDNKLENLRWDTVRANHMDKKRHGTFQSCERHGMAKLSLADVEFIRASNEKGTVLAAKFFVTPSTISMVRRGKTWRTESATARAEMNLR